MQYSLISQITVRFCEILFNNHFCYLFMYICIVTEEKYQTKQEVKQNVPNVVATNPLDNLDCNK